MYQQSRKRILVADDEADVLELVRVILHTKGYEVITASNGQDAYDIATGIDRPDMLITDLKMPGISGMELIKRIRANADVAELPILVISSLGTSLDKPDSFWVSGLGCDDFLAKPFDPLGLLGRVEYLIRRKDYVSERPAGSRNVNHNDEHGPSAEVRQANLKLLKSDDPTDVVRAFILSWNDQDFTTEYEALAEEMTYGLSMSEWSMRRLQSFKEDGGSTTHQIIDCECMNSSDVTATVACLRDDTIRGNSHRKDERYTLKKTPTGWKIMNVRSRPMAAFAVK